MATSGMSRRDFLRIGGGAGVGLWFIGRIGGQFFSVPVPSAVMMPVPVITTRRSDTVFSVAAT